MGVKEARARHASGQKIAHEAALVPDEPLLPPLEEGRTYRHYDDETKAAIIADVLLIGYGPTAAKWGISTNTLRNWNIKFPAHTGIRNARIGELISIYLEANIQALQAQAYVAQEPEYIRSQSAADLAVLHGVMADKSFRLLGALHEAQRRGLIATLPTDLPGGSSADTDGT